ncbi:MAG: hypothetical protein LC720_09490 [Actinobacteria bacterium]|nr:hypothetical protein [Actinomycetota bacterium]
MSNRLPLPRLTRRAPFAAGDTVLTSTPSYAITLYGRIRFLPVIIE